MPVRHRRDKELWMPNPGRTCLLLHGWQGAPGHMEPLGRYLHQMGLAVWIPVVGDELETGDWECRLDSLQIPPVVIGFSRGGLVALDLALRRELRGVITINAPLEFYEEENVPVRWLEELRRIKDSLSKVTVPALIVQAEDDKVVPPNGGKRIYEAIGSRCKHYWSCQGDHMIILKAGREELFARVGQFLRDVEEC